MTEVTKMQAKPMAIGETLSWPTPDGRFVIAVQRTTAACWNVTTEQGGFRIDALARTHTTESDARDLARHIATMLRDGATVDEVVAAIQPAADVIAAATALLVLADDADKLSPAQRTAILAADPAGHIDRRHVGTVKTLYALRDMHLGDLICRGYTPVRLELNGRGMQIKRYLEANRQHIAA